MLKEQGYIEEFSDDMLSRYGLTSRDKTVIKFLVDKAIEEKLYTDTKDYQHNLKHIERVIVYARMIMNKLDSVLINEEILMYATLYHDIGKTIGASNQEHGLVGSEKFKEIMKDKMNDKEIDIISKLIFQHASEENVIDFTNSTYSISEQQEIQLMSNVLKDADALDRNRLNYPAPIGTCDESKLRTSAAKDILLFTDSFYHDYCKANIDVREKESNSKILDNYELLNAWISQYKEGQENMFHASLDPSVDILRPTESTQKGSYVYAGINPTNCMTMAAFRFSTIFPRAKSNGIRSIMEIFPGSIEQTLSSKYITIYKLPNEKFHEYINAETAAPTKEWVSTESIEPIEQVSFKALDLLKYFVDTNQLEIIKNHTNEAQLMSLVKSFDVYIWNVKNIKSNPEIFEQKWNMMKEVMKYYSVEPDTLETIYKIKNNLDDNIYKYIEDFKVKNGREPDYDNEKECISPILNDFKNKVYIKNKNGQILDLNYEYINSLQLGEKGKKELQEAKVSVIKGQFAQRSDSEVKLSQQIRENDTMVKPQIEQQRSLEKPKVMTLMKPIISRGNPSIGGFVDTLILTVIIGFVAAICIVIYSLLK